MEVVGIGLVEKAAGAVVVGVDGSEASVAALHWASAQAVLERRPLAVIHAAMSSGIPTEGVTSETITDATYAVGRAVVRQACDLVEGRPPVPELRSEVVVGDPRAVLLGASEHAFLLVLGSRGRGPVRSLLLGSLGVSLTQHARCPTVVRRPHGTDAGGRGILVGTDGLRQSEPAVDWAYHQAALRSMPLTLVRTVVHGPPVGDISAEERGRDGLWAQLDAVVQQFGRRHPSVEVTLRLERGYPDVALARAASGMDTVVVGTHVRRSALRALDLDVTTRLVETAPCCVAVVPAADG